MSELQRRMQHQKKQSQLMILSESNAAHNSAAVQK